MRIGGFAGLSVAPFDAPLFARLSAAHAGRSSGNMTARWTTASLGGGAVLRVPAARFRAEPRASLLLDYLSVSATDTSSGRSDSGGQVGLGAQAGVSLVFESGWLCPLVGLEGYWLAVPTEIRVRDQEVAKVPAVGWSALAAARLFL
jgi:hypothetical protein